MSDRKSLIVTMADKFSMEPKSFENAIKATVLPANVSNEQFAAFLMVAHEYNLNPITKEIYGFPANGGIQPVVSVDGWLKMINSHPQFDGMEFKDSLAETGSLMSVTCKIYRKDRDHPIEVTEYMSECRRNTPTWKQWPMRMLRHKAAIQAARYAFSFAGIYDPDEAGRIVETVEAEIIEDVSRETIDQMKKAIDDDDPAALRELYDETGGRKSKAFRKLSSHHKGKAKDLLLQTSEKPIQEYFQAVLERDLTSAADIAEMMSDDQKMDACVLIKNKDADAHRGLINIDNDIVEAG